MNLIGLLTEEEKEIMENIESTNHKHVCGRWRGWIPLTWSAKLLNEMRREKLIGKMCRGYLRMSGIDIILLIRSLYVL